MKSTGIVRKVDELGRIVLIYIEGDTIILKKYQPACIFCDNARDIVTYRGKNVCSDCIRMLEEKI